MGVKRPEDQLQVLLRDTIVTLCKSTLQQHAEVSVEGLLGITLNSKEVFLVNINQTINNSTPTLRKRKSSHTENNGSDCIDMEIVETVTKHHKRKRRLTQDYDHDNIHFDEPETLRSPKRSGGHSSTGQSSKSTTSVSIISDSKIVIKREREDETWKVKQEDHVRQPKEEEKTKYSQTSHPSTPAANAPPPNDQDPGLVEQPLSEGGPGPMIDYSVLRIDRRNWLCPHCQKTFMSKQKLQNHLRTHTGEKPYTCNVCGKKFAVQWNLRAHVNVVHENQGSRGSRRSSTSPRRSAQSPRQRTASLPWQPNAPESSIGHPPSSSVLPEYNNPPPEMNSEPQGLDLNVIRHNDYQNPQQPVFPSSRPLELTPRVRSDSFSSNEDLSSPKSAAAAAAAAVTRFISSFDTPTSLPLKPSTKTLLPSIDSFSTSVRSPASRDPLDLSVNDTIHSATSLPSYQCNSGLGLLHMVAASMNRHDDHLPQNSLPSIHHIGNYGANRDSFMHMTDHRGSLQLDQHNLSPKLAKHCSEETYIGADYPMSSSSSPYGSVNEGRVSLGNCHDE